MVEGNTVRDGKKTGIVVWDRGRGKIRGNEILSNGMAGLQIRAGGGPLVESNVIYE